MMIVTKSLPSRRCIIIIIIIMIQMRILADEANSGGDDEVRKINHPSGGVGNRKRLATMTMTVLE